MLGVETVWLTYGWIVGVYFVHGDYQAQLDDNTELWRGECFLQREVLVRSSLGF